MSNSNGSTTATALRSPPRTPDRPTPSSGRPSTDRHHSTRERASTVTPEHRVYGRRPRRGLNSAGNMSSSTTSSTPASPAPSGQPQTDEQSTRGGLEGPLTPTGGRQTLQEFLQSIETVSRPARSERAGGHRHTVSSMGPGDTQSPRAVGRRRSMPLAGTDHSSAAAAGYPYGGANPPIPNSPPPSYQRGDYRGDLQEEGREPHPGRRVSMDNLASSFYLKPKWQPDVEVSECPICKRPFTFFYRKHHCRKCGRVVCANCSPHRITIPRQYIVEPPLEGCEGEQEETLRAETDDEGHEEALFGGQEVRLCNPCVPDPNPLPPPDYTSTTAQNILSTFPPQSPSEEQQQRTPTAAQQPQFDRSRYPRRSNSQRDWLGPFGESMPAEYVRQRSATDPHRRMGGPASPTTGHRHSRSHYGSIEQASSGMEAMGLHSAVQRSSSHRHRSHGSTSGLPYQHPYYQQQAQLSSERSLPNLTAPPFVQPASSTAAAAAAAAAAATAPPPRRIPEEDECPVCHEEMPPKGPDGSEEAREQHISECIDQHLHPGARTVPSARSTGDSTSAPDSDTTAAANPSTSAPSSSNFAAQMPVGGAGAAGAGASASASSSNAMNAVHYSHGGGGRRPRAETHAAGMGVFRRANMLVYHASEKDCLDAEGRQKECVICLEDFVVGAELGRLECWCVFHRPCIREWWDTKGLGACPTHQVGI